MTIEERDTMRAIQTIAKEMKKPRSIDWEQRRYEIAKDILAAAVMGGFQPSVKEAVSIADELIEELQKNPE